MFYSGSGLGGGAGTKPGKSGGGTAIPLKKHELVPETDPIKLTQFLSGANILKEGGSDPELRPHAEYPEWLWTLRLERKVVPLEEIEFDTWEYWRRMHKENKQRNRLILKNKYKYHKF